MASLRQIEANRRNALKSTGPKSPEGKAAVRMNALRCLRGSNTLGEKLRRICAELDTEGQTRMQPERLLVRQAAIAQWHVRQLELCENILFPRGSSLEEQAGLLDRLWISKTRFESTFHEACRALERILQNRQVPYNQAS